MFRGINDFKIITKLWQFWRHCIVVIHVVFTDTTTFIFVLLNSIDQRLTCITYIRSITCILATGKVIHDISTITAFGAHSGRELR